MVLEYLLLCVYFSEILHTSMTCFFSRHFFLPRFINNSYRNEVLYFGTLLWHVLLNSPNYRKCLFLPWGTPVLCIQNVLQRRPFYNYFMSSNKSFCNFWHSAVKTQVSQFSQVTWVLTDVSNLSTQVTWVLTNVCIKFG